MITYKVKPGGKLSDLWLSSLKFIKEDGMFKPLGSKHEISFSAYLFENDFEPIDILWNNDDMLDFAKWMRIASEEFPTINEEAIEKWKSFKTIKV